MAAKYRDFAVLTPVSHILSKLFSLRVELHKTQSAMSQCNQITEHLAASTLICTFFQRYHCM